MRHQPVLLEETLGLLLGPSAGVYVDGTVGGGGHAEQVLLRRPEALLYGFDRDSEAIRVARERLAGFGDRVVLVHGDFRRMGAALKKTESDGSPGFSWTSASPRCSWTIGNGASLSPGTALWI